MDGVLQLVFGCRPALLVDSRALRGRAASEPTTAPAVPHSARSRPHAPVSIGRMAVVRRELEARRHRRRRRRHERAGGRRPARRGVVRSACSCSRRGPTTALATRGAGPPTCSTRAPCPITHAWGYDSGALYPGGVIPFDRARVIGGCSSHNGCAALWGSRADYDGWAARGCAGWATDELLPLFHEVSRRLRGAPGRRTRSSGRTTAPCSTRPQALGIPRVRDLNDLDEDVGAGPFAANIRRRAQERRVRLSRSGARPAEPRRPGRRDRRSRRARGRPPRSGPRDPRTAGRS